MDQEVNNQVERFCSLWQGLNLIYEDYARSLNITYTSMYILTMISKLENCTQKKICQQTFLPKQTVNTIITGFYKKGWVELKELPEDRRVKAIHLTSLGKEYTDKFIPKIKSAEYKAMEQLSQSDREALLSTMDSYCKAFREAMLNDD
ncbi:MarR family transcriptional regulator [Thomasclavelia sp.]|uniref:MarR family winged helix-turn-helix transcriptional regulator n=1 Tax=Thomasclavelia sp. TaxID=3025757 RepID=UPI0025D9F311|nr:MarR family transcriptional regulator [Thomasclavelia sp.]